MPKPTRRRSTLSRKGRFERLEGRELLASDLQVHVLLNGQSADSGPTAQINQGAPLDWTYQLTNAGTTSLSGVKVSDDNGTPTNTADDFSPTASLGATVTSLTLEKTISGVTGARFVDTPNYVFASLPGANSVDVFNAQTLAVVATIPVGSTPEGMALSNDGTKLYVADSNGDAISVIDTTTLGTLPSIALSTNASDVAVGADGRLFVLETSAIAQINPSTGASAGPNIVANGMLVYGGQIIVSPDKDRLYYADFGVSPASLYQFNLTTNTPTLMWSNSLTLGDNGQDLALSADGSMLSFVCGDGQGSYQIAEFRTSDMAQLGLLSTGAYPREIAFSPDGQTAFTAHTSGQVEFWNTSTFSELGTATTTGATTQLGVDAAGAYLYDSVNGTIAIYKINSTPTAYNIGDTNHNGLLDSGETWTYTASGIAQAGSWTDTVTASATDSNSQSVSQTDTTTYDGIGYVIALADQLNGAAATIAPGTEVGAGGANVWTYTVTNPGSVTLASVVVTDDDGAPGSAGDDLTAAYVSGDTNDDGLLEPGETWTFTATAAAQSGLTTETALVTATPVSNQGQPLAGAPQVSASAISYYQGVAPNVTVQTTVNSASANSLPGAPAVIGSTYTREIKVGNTGTAAVSNVKVTDDNGTPGVTSDDFIPSPTLGENVSIGALEDTFPNLTAARFLSDPTRPYVYATIPATSSVAVFNTTTMSLIATIPVGSTPEGMALSNDGTKLYVADSTGDAISVIGTTTLSTLPSITLSTNPSDVAVGADGRLFVLETSAIAQINPSTGASAGPNLSGGGLSVSGGQIIVSPDKDRLYYANFGLSPATLYQFDISTNTPTLINATPNDGTPSNGQDLALSADGSMIAFACGYGQDGYQIAEYRTSDMSEVGVFVTGPYPREIAFSPDGQTAFTAHTANQIEAWNTSSFASLGSAATTGATTQLGVDGAGTDLFASVNGTIAVYRINTATTSYNVGDLNHNGKLDPGETWVYTSTGVAQSGVQTDQITVTGTDPFASTVAASDASSYYGVATLECVQGVGGKSLLNLAPVLGSGTTSYSVSDSRFSVANGWLQANSGQTLIASADTGLTLLVRNNASSKIVDEVDLRVSANTLPWHNAALPDDVNGNGSVTPLDALNVISALNTYGGGSLVALPVLGSVQMVDVNGDGSLTPLDALRVISYLNEASTGNIAASTVDPSIPAPTDAPATSLLAAGGSTAASVVPVGSLASSTVSSTGAFDLAAIAGTAVLGVPVASPLAAGALAAAWTMPLASRIALIDAAFAAPAVSHIDGDSAADALASALRPRRGADAASAVASAPNGSKLSTSIDPNDESNL